MKKLFHHAHFLSVVFFIVFTGLLSTVQAQDIRDTADFRRVAQYVIERILQGKADSVTLWTTPSALDKSHVARDLRPAKTPDLVFPFERSWLVMIDDQPGANFGHRVRWVFVKDDFTTHSEIYTRDFPPIVLSDLGKGKVIDFHCRALTRLPCPELGAVLDVKPGKLLSANNCKYAVLVSGGINTSSNYSRYPQNLKSMYNMLRTAGFPKNHIYVYYASGNLPLDCDNADGDNNNATGNDVTAGAIEATIRARLQDLCGRLDPKNDILFTYFSNHGADDDGVCLWDVTGNGLGNDELYSPAELASDVANCKVLRQYMIHDQCYAGDFLPMATDGNHNNLVVYAAATATEVSWGREYMARWEQNDITAVTLNAMHQDVVNNGNLSSTAGMSEGTAGTGNHKASESCLKVRKPWWKRYWYVFLLIIPVLIILYRAGGKRP